MFGFLDGGFKSADARLAYMAAYDELRALSPRPDVVHDIRTTFGTIRVYQHGPDGGAPIVLIHGYFLSSAMWWEQVRGLANDFTVYTLDALGQPGASIQTKPIYTATDGARYVDEVLEGLALRDVHLVGHSYGGWLATHTAARAPHRLATATLVDPANTVTRTYQWFWRNLFATIGRPNSARAERFAASVTGNPAPGSSIARLTGLFGAGFAAFAPPVRAASPFFPSDRLLRSIQLPIQVLLAGNSIHDSDKGIERMKAVVPHWRHSLWPNATHSLPAEIPDEVNSCIRQFVMEHA